MHYNQFGAQNDMFERRRFWIDLDTSQAPMSRHAAAEYEIECVPGLETVVLDEIGGLRSSQLAGAYKSRSGFVRLHWRGLDTELESLRSAIALYQSHHFDVPRPKALLGHQHFTRLVSAVKVIIATWQRKPFSLGIGAAGANSPVMRRLKRELALALGTQPSSDEKGELYLRLARRGKGWEALIRTTAKPLSTRPWRRVDAAGALNATVAFAMTRLAAARGDGIIANLCCGTGTIAIEGALTANEIKLVAIDNCAEMLSAARQNIAASRSRKRIELLHADGCRTPLPDSSIGAIIADLPFGGAIGSHTQNLTLYPALLREAARIGADSAVCVLLTHEINLLRRCLGASEWRIMDERRINLSGLHPRIFVLKRNAA